MSYNSNFKPLEDLYNTLNRQQEKNTVNDNRSRYLLATVQSVQATTVTIRIDGDTFDLAGIPLKDGITVVATDRVRLQSLNNGFQVGSFIVDSKI